MRTLILALSLLAAPAFATDIVLDPGGTYQYLQQTCGDRTAEEVALGWNADGTALVQVQVSTTCKLSAGRYRVARYVHYAACWFVSFSVDGSMMSQQKISDELCVGGDAGASFVNGDTALWTTLVSYVTSTLKFGNRAVISTPDSE